MARKPRVQFPGAVYRVLERGGFFCDEGDAKERRSQAVRLALVRQTTIASNAWIAERLRMGHPNRVSHSCSRRRWQENSDLVHELKRLENP